MKLQQLKNSIYINHRSILLGVKLGNPFVAAADADDVAKSANLAAPPDKF